MRGADSDDDVPRVNMTVEGYYIPSAATSQDLTDGQLDGKESLWLMSTFYNKSASTVFMTLFLLQISMMMTILTWVRWL